MSQSDMDELLVFPQQIPSHEALFEQTPLWIAKMYLECFDSTGRQVRRVPRHILEALAKRLRLVVEGDVKSLDEAFGGGVRRQRKHIDEGYRQFRVSWEMRRAMEAIKEQSPSERGKGTPYEIALERVAEELDLASENVHRIYKAAGKR